MLASLLLLAPFIPAEAAAHEHELSLGAATFQYQSFLRSSARPAFNVLELAYHHPAGSEGVWNNVLLGGGVRAGLAPLFSDVSLPAEVFARARLRARMGFWEVGVGPEIGVSGFAKLRVRPIPAEGEDEKEAALLSPVYVAVGAAPLRFHLGRFFVSALECHVGTSSFPRSSAIRLHLGLLNVGGTL
jgi:hypothetical protein